MNVNSFVKSMLPVVAGVMVAGYLIDALRGNSVIDAIHNGYDS